MIGSRKQAHIEHTHTHSSYVDLDGGFWTREMNLRGDVLRNTDVQVEGVQICHQNLNTANKRCAGAVPRCAPTVDGRKKKDN